MKNNSTIEKMDRRVVQTLKGLVPRIQNRLNRISEITRRATYKIAREVGKDLISAQMLCEKAKIPFTHWLENNFDLSADSARNYIKIASDKGASARHYPSISEHLRKFNPNYGMPRQKVDEVDFEPAGKTILDGISTGIFVERTLTESKEKGLKKKMALELVDAGFRALSIKAHSDTGGSDEVMRRLSEVRAALKDAIEDGDAYL